MKAKPSPKLNSETQEKIIDHWRFKKENSIKEIALHFNCSQHQINKVIDNYLNKKIRS